MEMIFIIMIREKTFLCCYQVIFITSPSLPTIMVLTTVIPNRVLLPGYFVTRALNS